MKSAFTYGHADWCTCWKQLESRRTAVFQHGEANFSWRRIFARSTCWKQQLQQGRSCIFQCRTRNSWRHAFGDRALDGSQTCLTGCERTKIAVWGWRPRERAKSWRVFSTLQNYATWSRGEASLKSRLEQVEMKAALMPQTQSCNWHWKRSWLITRQHKGCWSITLLALKPDTMR